eukprot:GHVR01048303.1.p1 GENE.GHVR01048303.1~~GHVR01048303.1.p1  ORF type:complete len:283 (-),score=90.14 GHVR01048303.1:65-913(-)
MERETPKEKLSLKDAGLMVYKEIMVDSKTTREPERAPLLAEYEEAKRHADAARVKLSQFDEQQKIDYWFLYNNKRKSKEETRSEAYRRAKEEDQNFDNSNFDTTKIEDDKTINNDDNVVNDDDNDKLVNINSVDNAKKVLALWMHRIRTDEMMEFIHRDDIKQVYTTRLEQLITAAEELGEKKKAKQLRTCLKIYSEGTYNKDAMLSIANTDGGECIGTLVDNDRLLLSPSPTLAPIPDTSPPTQNKSSMHNKKNLTHTHNKNNHTEVNSKERPKKRHCLEA